MSTYSDFSVDVAHPDLDERASDLLAGLLREPWGQVSPSVYETARLVALAPWLPGHAERVAYLLDAQRPDGGWGGPAGYALVPTLSAADAVLAVLGRSPADGDQARLERSADRALRMLARLLAELDADALPDMPAVDLITASLVDSVEERLRVLADAGFPGLDLRAHRASLRLPAGLDRGRLKLVLGALDAGAPLPEKVFHALEVAGPAASGAVGAPPAETGTIGASPAATAAWLGTPDRLDPGHPAHRFLESVIRRHGGPVPCGFPITVFERSWVLGTLLRAGLSPVVPDGLAAELSAAIGPDGARTASGLPGDVDTTSASLYALALLGVGRTPDPLWRYELDTHFCTWPGEDGASPSANAHVLDALGQYLKSVPQGSYTGNPETVHRSAAAVRKLTSWLIGRQHEDGRWHDRWHASPYYATSCCALALSEFGGAEARAAVTAATRWVLETQLPDGSWGVWGGTAEETAYALHVLLLAGPATGLATERAVAAGHRSLLRSAESAERPAMWHDKDLYLPKAVVEAAILAALHLARRREAGSLDDFR